MPHHGFKIVETRKTNILYVGSLQPLQHTNPPPLLFFIFYFYYIFLLCDGWPLEPLSHIAFLSVGVPILEHSPYFYPRDPTGNSWRCVWTCAPCIKTSCCLESNTGAIITLWIRADHTWFESRMVQQEPGEIWTINGQTEYTKFL